MELLFRQKSSIRCSSHFSLPSGPELVLVLLQSRRLSKNTAVRLPSGARPVKEPPSPSVSPVSAMARPIGDAGADHPPAAKAERLLVRDSRHQLDISRGMVLSCSQHTLGASYSLRLPLGEWPRLPFIISCPI